MASKRKNTQSNQYPPRTSTRRRKSIAPTKEERRKARLQEEEAEGSANVWDEQNFPLQKCWKLYNEVTKHEHICTGMQVDFDALANIGLDIRDYFASIGLEKYMSFDTKLVYPDLVKIFYANCKLFDTDENEELGIVVSMVRGKQIQIDDGFLADLFDLPLEGFYFAIDGSTHDLDEGFNALESRRSLLEFEHEPTFTSLMFKAVPRLIHMIICHNILPRSGSYDYVSVLDNQLLWCILNKKNINVPSIIMYEIVNRLKTIKGPNYTSMINKVGLLYGRMFTKIFEHAGIDLSMETSVKLNKSYLNTCNIVKGKESGWKLLKFVPTDEELEIGSRGAKQAKKGGQSYSATPQRPWEVDEQAYINSLDAPFQYLSWKLDRVSLRLQSVEERVVGLETAFEGATPEEQRTFQHLYQRRAFSSTATETATAPSSSQPPNPFPVESSFPSDENQ